MNLFDKVVIPIKGRSNAKLDSFHVGTTDFGRLDVPYWCDCVPGDDITFNLRAFFQASPLVCPTRGRVHYDVRAFFVPNRILTNKDSFDFDNWITNVSNSAHPYTTEQALVRKLKDGGLSAEEKLDLRRIFSQMRLPDRVFNPPVGDWEYEHPERLDTWPLQAYQYIWWAFYRDSNLIDESQKSNYVDFVNAGYNELTHLRPLYACFDRDPFTTAKVNPQDGGYKAVGIGSVPSSGITSALQEPPNSNNVRYSQDNIVPMALNGSNTQFLRAAQALTRFLERNNVPGGRPLARYLARYGVAPTSLKMDQPQYLGGNRCLMQIGGITAPTSAGDSAYEGNPFIQDYGNFQGQISGKAAIDLQFRPEDKPLNFHVTEYGTFMVIATLVPEVGYYQGLHKSWQRGVDNVKQTYLIPEFQEQGYEPIFNKELAMCNLEEDSTNQNIFGFWRRYMSYLYMNNVVSGDMVMRETKTGMQSFHLLRDFGDSGTVYAPALTPSFTMITPSLRHQFDRIFQIEGTHNQFDHFEGFLQCWCNVERSISDSPLPCEEDTGKSVYVDNGGTRFN